MKRRDSLASLFTGHGTYNLFGEDKELLRDSEDDETRVFSPKESETRPSFVVGKGDSSGSLSTLSDDELQVRPETCDSKNNSTNRKEGRRERLSLSLSDLFSRVGKPKTQTSRPEFIVTRPQKSKVNLCDKISQVSSN